MKQLIFILLSFATSTLVFAQPTLQATDVGPVAHQATYYYTCDTAHVLKPAAGVNMIWDYSGLVTQEYHISRFVNCQETIHCDSFPGTNLVSIDSGFYTYIVSDSNSSAVIGYFETDSVTGMGDMLIHFTPRQEYAFYPMVYNATHTNTWRSLYKVPLNYELKQGVNNFICDGYGTLKLPSGTYNNALCIHKTGTETDTFNFKGTPFTIASQIEEYTWYAAGYHSPLLTIRYNIAIFDSQPSTQQSSMNVVFSTPFPLGINNVPQANSAITAYPNPCNDMLYISGLPLSSDITVYNVSGVQVLHTSINNSGTVNELSVRSLQPGIYFLIAKSDSSNTFKTTFIKAQQY